MGRRFFHNKFLLLEILFSIATIVLIVAVVLPMLSSARLKSYRENCATNQHVLGQAWDLYLNDHQDAFPVLNSLRASWDYGGAYARVQNNQFELDSDRPLNQYLPMNGGSKQTAQVFQCPADRGIRGETPGVGTDDKSVFEAFGTSYRANALLLGQSEVSDEPASPLVRGAITTDHSRLLILGCPLWYEQLHSTGRQANWFGDDYTNLLFLDGSVRYRQVRALPDVGAVVVDPFLGGSVFPSESE